MNTTTPRPADTNEQTRDHLEREVREMLAHLQPRHLTTSELLAMAEALRPAHARFMTIPTGERPLLRVEPRGFESHGTESP